MVSLTFDVWIGIGLVIAFAIDLSGLSRHSTVRWTVGLCGGALGVILLSFGALVSFLQLMLPSVGPSYPIALVTELGQVVLLAIVLMAVSKRQGRDLNAPEPDVAVDLVDSAKAGR